jgi:hypothetical protein
MGSIKQEVPMTKVQKIYRILRAHVSREEARYAAVRLMQIFAK